ncbi:tetratricopeptide repeat protein, partial [Acinetobacter baumannii]
LFNRGDCLVNLAKYKEAVADYSAAIKLNPERTRAYVSRAKVYDKMGRSDLADADRKLLRDRGDTFD